MKVLALVILVVASATGKGSGPYLPSGWKPQGPAFYLPSEEKPSENPLKDLILSGTEAAGSDSLLEYGPPKVQELSQNLINQGLPDIVTEQIFEVIPVVPLVVAEVKEEAVENSEAKTEQTATSQSEATTESLTLEDKALSVDLPIIEVESFVESSKTTLADGVETTNSNVKVIQFGNFVASEGSTQNVETSQQTSQKTETNQQSSQQSSTSNFEVSNLERIVSEQVSQDSVNQQDSVTSASQSQTDASEKSEENAALIAEVTLQQAQNIPEIIASLENEIKAQQAEAIEAVSDVTTVQTTGTAEHVPEGFLEYGPPGFEEYGPPKGGLTEETDENKAPNIFEYNNEARRRRFSPKFKSTKKH